MSLLHLTTTHYHCLSDDTATVWYPAERKDIPERITQALFAHEPPYHLYDWYLSQCKHAWDDPENILADVWVQEDCQGY